MKWKDKIIIYVVALMLLFHIPLHADAKQTEYASIPVTGEKKELFIDTINIVSLNEEVSKDSIACFNVHPNGNFALGFENMDKKIIQVYSSEGFFEYGYSFIYDGGFAVIFEGENVSVYFAKSGYIAQFTPDAACISLEYVPLTQENNKIMRGLLYATQINAEALIYKLERDIGFSLRSYSRLVVSDGLGNKKVLYDVSFLHNLKMILVLCIVCSFILIGVINLIKRHGLQKKTFC